MDRLAFEQLVSAWLDDRQNSILRRRIDAACAADPACRRIRADYEALDWLVRQVAERPLPLDWSAFRLAISARIAGTAPSATNSAKLDRLLREALPAVEPRVNWDRYARRVSQAIDRSTRTGRVLHIPRWRTIAAAASLAAAAAVILWISLPFGGAPVAQPGPTPAVVLSKPPAPGPEQLSAPDVPRPSSVRCPAVAVNISNPDAAVAPEPGPAVASAIPRNPAMVRVHVMEERTPPPAIGHSSHRQASRRTSEPEVFFMLEPPDYSASSSSGGFGSY